MMAEGYVKIVQEPHYNIRQWKTDGKYQLIYQLTTDNLTPSDLISLRNDLDDIIKRVSVPHN